MAALLFAVLGTSFVSPVNSQSKHETIALIRVGSPTEIAAALYEFGKATVSPSTRAFTTDTSSFSIAKRLCFSDTPATFASIAHDLGLEMSDRSARRIMDGEIEPSANVLDRIKIESTMLDELVPHKKPSKPSRKSTTLNTSVSLSNEDAAELEPGFQQAFNDFASKYYLLSDVEPTIEIVKWLSRDFLSSCNLGIAA